mmetsp:Transcript_62338/g.193195  ORF Transcript_62338/g.193195 Transcript_62338/m.193195 type:complete len:230 (-) Transcript_62338:694-1383(-)
MCAVLAGQVGAGVEGGRSRGIRSHPLRRGGPRLGQLGGRGARGQRAGGARQGGHLDGHFGWARRSHGLRHPHPRLQLRRRRCLAEAAGEDLQPAIGPERLALHAPGAQEAGLGVARPKPRRRGDHDLRGAGLQLLGLGGRWPRRAARPSRGGGRRPVAGHRHGLEPGHLRQRTRPQHQRGRHRSVVRAAAVQDPLGQAGHAVRFAGNSLRARSAGLDVAGHRPGGHGGA